MAGYINQRYRSHSEARKIVDCFLNAEKVQICQEQMDSFRELTKYFQDIASTDEQRFKAQELRRLYWLLDEALFDEEYIDNIPEPEGGTNDLE